MKELVSRAENILEKANIQEKKNKISEIEKLAQQPDFWDNSQEAAKKMQQMAALQKEVDELEHLRLLVSQDDESKLNDLVEELELYLYLSGKYDKSNAIFSIHSGQGGVDAMDFASMLFRMYTRYFEAKGFKSETLESSSGEEAGLKSVTLLVEGDFAYGYLKGEQGVHRLVRLSPFNANNLRQTSFARVEVLPQIEEEEDVKISDDDLQWDFFRSGGHGGQNVNKVSTAVRLTHTPTGIVVSSQSQRHQAQNREYALNVLKSKLWAKMQEDRKEKEDALKGEYQAPSWGNAIRSYVLHPYQMVKDTRTGVESGNVDKVLDGGIDEFITAELKLGKR